MGGTGRWDFHGAEPRVRSRPAHESDRGTVPSFCECFTELPSSALKEWEACRKESCG